MATAKKKTTKAVKKAAPKTTKRTYTRKAAPKVHVEDVVAPAEATAASSLLHVEHASDLGGAIENLDPSQKLVVPVSALKTLLNITTLETQVKTRRETLQSSLEDRESAHEAQCNVIRQAEYISFYDVPAHVCALVLAELQGMGYLTTCGRPVLAGGDMINADVLVLNHDNKLVDETSTNSEGFKNSKKILRINGVRWDSNFFFQLGDNKPNTIERDGATYVRID